MTEYSSKTLRAAMKAKAARLASGSDATKIGASDFTPAEALNADVQTGARPLTRRRFKSGGKVVGAANAPRADKKKRGNSDLSADSFINRNVVEANEEREGKKHIGAFKKGGRAHKLSGGKLADYANKAAKSRAGAERGAEYLERNNATGEGGMGTHAKFKNEAGKRTKGLAMAAAKLYGTKGFGVNVPASKDDAMKSGGRAKHATDGTVKGKKAPARDPYEGEITTRSVTGPGGKYVTDDEIRKGAGSDYPPMPPVRPAPMPPERPSNLKKGGKAEAKCWGGRSKKAPGGSAQNEMNADEMKRIMQSMGTSSRGATGQDMGYQAPSIATGQDMGYKAPEMGQQDMGNRMKKGGRAKKFMGGPMMQPGGTMQGAGGAMKPEPNKDNPADMVDKNRLNFGTGPSGSPYKKGGKVAFEGSAKDTMQDTKLAKKYGMSMMAWEKSKQDKKHDEQESTAGLKKGGRAKRASGGRAKGKTNIEIVIDTGKRQPQDGLMPNNGGMPPKQPSPAMPMQAAPPAGPPPMPPAGAGGPPPMPPAGAGGPPPMPMRGPAGGPPQMPAGLEKMMQRKAGGRVYKSYKDMDAGSGSGLGRLEKTEIAKRTAHKHGGKAYKSYKDMDAGAASGMGRLEKTEIAARGR
jgi:hypothetical protein